MGLSCFFRCICGSAKEVSDEARVHKAGAVSGTLGEQDSAVFPTGPSNIALDGLTNSRVEASGSRHLRAAQGHAHANGHAHGGSGTWLAGATFAEGSNHKAASEAVASVSVSCGHEGAVLPSCRALSQSSVHSGRAPRSFTMASMRRHTNSRVLPAEAAAALAAAVAGHDAATGSGSGVGNGGSGSGTEALQQRQQQLAATAGTMFKATTSFRRHSCDPLGSALMVVRGRLGGPSYTAVQRTSPLPNQQPHHLLIKAGARQVHSFSVASNRGGPPPPRGHRSARPTADGIVGSRAGSVTGFRSGRGGGSVSKKKSDRGGSLHAAAAAAVAAAAAAAPPGTDTEGEDEDDVGALQTDPRVESSMALSPRASSFPARSMASYTRYHQPLAALRALGIPRPQEVQPPGRVNDRGRHDSDASSTAGRGSAADREGSVWSGRRDSTGQATRFSAPRTCRDGADGEEQGHGCQEQREQEGEEQEHDLEQGQGQGQQQGQRGGRRLPPLRNAAYSSRRCPSPPPPELAAAAVGGGGLGLAFGGRVSARQLLAAPPDFGSGDDSSGEDELLRGDGDGEAAAATAAAARKAERPPLGVAGERHYSERYLLSRQMRPQRSILKKESAYASGAPGLHPPSTVTSIAAEADVGRLGCPAATAEGSDTTEAYRPPTPEPHGAPSASGRASAGSAAAAAGDAADAEATAAVAAAAPNQPSSHAAAATHEPDVSDEGEGSQLGSAAAQVFSRPGSAE